MKQPRITPVILCGGSGTRLWPRSRATRPKPFLPLLGEQTLFEQAVRRCRGDAFEKPIIVTGAAHVGLVDGYVNAGEVAEVIVEPQPRQTAAAVALAARRLPPEAVMLVCSSDQHIGDCNAFRDASLAAAELARRGWLVCLGIPATAAETRFGYIQRGEPVGPGAFRVAKFVEKPDRVTAEAYVNSGEFVWNGGIFAFRAKDYLAELQRHRPIIAAAVRDAVDLGQSTSHRFYPEPTAFSRTDPESLDYAIMENTDRAAMVLTDMHWSDVGDWQTVKQMRDKDANGNSIRGSAELIDCRNLLIDTDGPKVYAIGLHDLAIVIDGNDILIASEAGAAKIGKLRKAAEE